MAINKTVLKNRQGFTPAPGEVPSLPNLSTQLDSVRIYNYEVQFNGEFAKSTNLSLAAKRVQSSGHSVEDIPVRRFNDLYHYAGAATSEDLIITFDQLLLTDPIYGRAAGYLYEWFRNTSYNVRSGIVSNAGTSKLHSVDVIHYDNEKSIQSITSYYGVIVAKFAPGEKNYATANEFHTFDVTFRYDFMEHLDGGSDGDTFVINTPQQLSIARTNV